jgi:prephenate dehydrogenase
VSPGKPVVAIVGTGLIGASLALAFKKSGFCGNVPGYSRRKETLEQAVAAGAVDTELEKPQDAVDADIVMLAAPVGAIISHLRVLGSSGCASRLIMDVGSVKAPILKAAVEAGLGRRFVGGHPMAGSIEHGPAHASSDLFKDRTFFLTPTEETSKEALQTVKELVKAVGAKIVEIDADEHDRTVALTSHLPYLLSAALSQLASGQSGSLTHVREAVAGAFRSATHLADGSPEMWADIISGNAGNVEEWLKRLRELAGNLLQAGGNPDRLQSILASIRDTHNGLLERLS